MKPRTKFEKAVVSANARLKPIQPKVVEWAVTKLIPHYAFRTSQVHCTCGDCGTKFDKKGKCKYVRCPHCGRRLQVVDTLKRKQREATYFSTLETIDGLQVQRVFLLQVMYHKGKAIHFEDWEVCRWWLNAKGKTALTARVRLSGYFVDSFSWYSDIELRKSYYVHTHIADTYVYPRYAVLPELKRNGMAGKIPDVHPMKLMEKLLTDNRIETLMKAKAHKALTYFLSYPDNLEKCWASYKIATRQGYVPEDISLWCDMVDCLDRCGRDIHSPKYICPINLKAEHDRWLAKVRDLERKRQEKERLERAKAQEAEFYKAKSCYFGIVIQDGDIEVSVLNSIEAYKNEGDYMHHCVFQCEYYAKTDTLVLSAHDREGNRIETVEFSLTEGKVIQSRGVCNKNTEHHDRIVNLVNAHAHLFFEAQKTA